MGMIAKIEILSFCNVSSEMGMEEIFDICCEANQLGARVDYLPAEAFNRVSFPIGSPTTDFLREGVVVVWKGHVTSQNQLIEAVIKELTEDE